MNFTAEILPFVPALDNASEGKRIILGLISQRKILMGGYFMSITEFFKSPTASIGTGIVILILLGLFVLNLRKGKSLSVKTLTYAAICIALAMVLSNVKLFKMPYGGTVSACSMLFVSLIGYWFGLGAGLLAAITYGLLQLIIDPYVVHPIQLLLDYPFAFGALGLSGLFSSKKHGLYKGYVTGAMVRWFFSTLSGFVFFGSYAADFNLSPIAYSSIYNFLYIGPEIVLSLLLVSIPAFNKAIETVKNMAGRQAFISIT